MFTVFAVIGGGQVVSSPALNPSDQGGGEHPNGPNDLARRSEPLTV